MHHLLIAIVFFLAGGLTWGCWSEGERKAAYLYLAGVAVLAAILTVVEVFR